ncbi:unnamed protein product [Calypogeia fissa]
MPITTMQALSWSYVTTVQAQTQAQFDGYHHHHHHHHGKASAAAATGNSAAAAAGGGDFPSWALSPDPNSHLHSRVLQVGSARLDTFARFHRGFQQQQTLCNSASPSCPQRPFSSDSSNGTVEHSGRHNVAGGSGRKTHTNNSSSKGVNKTLRPSSQKQKNASQSASTQAVAASSSSLMRPNSPTDEEGFSSTNSMPISLNSPSHTSGSVFLPSALVDIPFPECLRLKENLRVSISSIFRMALICCVVAQWIKIAGALSMWTSRLRLKFFDSPLSYKNSTRWSKAGRIGVFWDLENCPVPSGCEIPTVVDKVRAIGNHFGDIQCFRAYGKLEYLARQALPFLSKDVELCPVPDGKESADKAIILDASLFAFDHKPCLPDSEDTGTKNDVVLVVTGDRGFAALLKELSKRNVTTIVIGNAHQELPFVLGQFADFSLGWDDMMMVCDECDNELFDKFNKSVICSCSGKSQTGGGTSMRTGCCYGDEPDSESETVRMDLQDSSGVDCYQLDSSGSELFCTTSSEHSHPLVQGLQKVVSYSSTKGLSVDGMVVKQTECNFCESTDDRKPLLVPIGGKIRVLRHLRYEIAAIADKHCNKGTRIDLREFVRLYEVEMGHTLIPGYYGCGSMKTLLETMPDVITLRPFSSNSLELEVFPFYPKGRQSYGRINYSREDLRCILYELLRSKWPYGVKKESLGTEHMKMTGRPFVLISYEFLKAGDVFGSMRDIVHVDPRTKQLHLVNGAEEPAGYAAFAQNQWS